MNLARLITIAGLAALKSADGEVLFPETTLRSWMHTNLDGFRERCVVRLGQRVTVDLDALDAWLEERRGTKTAKPNSGPRTATRQQRGAPLKSFDRILQEAGRA